MRTTIISMAAAWMLMTAPAEAVTLSFNPATQEVAPGSQVRVEVAISGLTTGGAPSLGAYYLDIAFQPGVLAFQDFEFGDPELGDQLDLFGLGSITKVAPGTETVNLFELSLDSPDDLDALQVGGFKLGALIFEVTGTGVSPLSFTVNALGDAVGDPLTASLETASITSRTTTVPEPATVFLLLAGLPLLRLARRRAHHT